MGIYDDGYTPGFTAADLGKYAKLLAVLFLLAAAYYAMGQVNEALKPQPLEIRLEKEKIKPSETLLLNVKVTNTTGKDASEVVLLVKARDEKSINITPLTSKIIKSLPANEWRQLDFLVNPIGSISPGGFTITVETILSDQKFAKSAVVTVEG